MTVLERDHRRFVIVKHWVPLPLAVPRNRKVKD